MHSETEASRMKGVDKSRQGSQVRFSLIREQAISDLRIVALTAKAARLFDRLLFNAEGGGPGDVQCS